MAIPFEFIRDYSIRMKTISKQVFCNTNTDNVETTAGIAMLAALLLPAYDRVLMDDANYKTDNEKKLHSEFISKLGKVDFDFGNAFDQHFTIDEISRNEWTGIKTTIDQSKPLKLQYSPALKNIRNAIAHGHVFYLNNDRIVVEGDETKGVAFVRNRKKKTHVSILSNASLKKLFDTLHTFLGADR